jgi:hypothetical protein
MRGDKKLNVYTLADLNPLMSTLFAFLMLLVKRYPQFKYILIYIYFFYFNIAMKQGKNY